MKIQTSQNMTDKKIIEVKTVRTDEDANELFVKGWILLHGGICHIDTQGYNTKPVFVMARTE